MRTRSVLRLKMQIVVDPQTNRSKGYGFVRFSDEAEKERAMHEMQGERAGHLNSGTASFLETGHSCFHFGILHATAELVKSYEAQ